MVDFHCRVTINRGVLLNFYAVYARPSIFYLYFIYARKIHARMQRRKYTLTVEIEKVSAWSCVVYVFQATIPRKRAIRTKDTLLWLENIFIVQVPVVQKMDSYPPDKSL